MEVEEATKPANGEQTGVPSLDQSQVTVEGSNDKFQLENQANSTEAASKGKSPKTQVKQEGEKRKDPKEEGPAQDGPSKRVREGQKWNDRPRKQYGNQDDRPRKRYNNKSDLVSQQESSDPVAIRKQVFHFPMLCSFIYSNNHLRSSFTSQTPTF